MRSLTDSAAFAPREPATANSRSTPWPVPLPHDQFTLALPSPASRYKMSPSIWLSGNDGTTQRSNHSQLGCRGPSGTRKNPAGPVSALSRESPRNKKSAGVARNGQWQVRAYPHFRPLYRIEGDPGRSAEGIYDRMAPIGAHEIIVETPDHTRTLAQISDEEIERVLEAYGRAHRRSEARCAIQVRTVFKNQGAQSGEEWPHCPFSSHRHDFRPAPHLYELRAAREWYRDKERCVFCDILRQEIRQTQARRG